jgi:phosphoserine phosphatase
MTLPSRSSVAAFFDIDGTLLPGPSLERRFLRSLRTNRCIPATNNFSWFVEAIRLAPLGKAWAIHGNKIHLRGIPATAAESGGLFYLESHCEDTLQVHPQGLKQLEWHAALGHRLILVSGTLMPLAHEFALMLTKQLAARKLVVPIRVYATRLAVDSGRWTGRILGNPVFGRYKAQAIQVVASCEGVDPSRCFAYGNSADDRWMLAAVGRPFAVNPSFRLARIVKHQGWPILDWQGPISAPAEHQNASGRKLCINAQTSYVLNQRPFSPGDKEHLLTPIQWIRSSTDSASTIAPSSSVRTTSRSGTVLASSTASLSPTSRSHPS